MMPAGEELHSGWLASQAASGAIVNIPWPHETNLGPIAPGGPMMPVFYTPALVADAESFSPSASKPALVVAAWQAARLALEVRAPGSASPQDLALAHDPDYVAAVLAGERINGFGNRLPSVAASLPYTAGAMVDAARLACETRGVACAPVSGFHHAGYAHGGGYCTFNGLVVAARKMLQEGLAHRVMILDCDMHYGDGIDDILDVLGIGPDQIVHHTFGERFSAPEEADAYLAHLDAVVEEFRDVDLVLYQAGADVHVDDPLGGVLNTDEMRQRDQRVFEAARDASVPLAWNLAGGYQDPVSRVVALHVQTLRCALAAASLPSRFPA